VQLFPPLVPILALLLTMRARLAEAIECEEGAIEAARLVDNAQALAWALFHRAFTALQRATWTRRSPPARRASS
jgi:hypothetical protein